MDVDDDDEYMNAAAAHAAFVMTVSSAGMYWLLCHAQHARDTNIHKLHPLPEKNRLGLCRFSAQWNTPLNLVINEVKLWAVGVTGQLAVSQMQPKEGKLSTQSRRWHPRVVQ